MFQFRVKSYFQAWILKSTFMNEFTIKDIENLSGIKAHTLRIWEQRYQILVPKRKDSNHRIYNNEDLKHILRVAYLYHNGYKISKIAQLKRDELKKLTIDSIQPSHYVDAYINQLIEASIDFDEEKFERVFSNALLHIGFENSILQIAYPFLERIGLLWVTDHVIPAQEHFASSIIKRKFSVAIDGLDHTIRQKRDENFLLFTPEGEWHEIPLLFSQYLLKKNGFHSIYFGSNVPLEDLKYFIGRRHIAHICFHMITNLTKEPIDDYIQQLCDAFPYSNIVMTGPQVNQVITKRNNLTLINDLNGFKRFMEKRSSARHWV